MYADLLLRGGSVLDGSGDPAVPADVAIAGDRIAAVGPELAVSARRAIDVHGLVVCPGFVDMHAHSDLQILAAPDHLPKVAQGITTEVLGQDGLSYAPVTDETLPLLRAQLRGWNGDPPEFDWSWHSVAGYLERLNRGIAVNAAYLVPHGTIRLLVVGTADRRAAPAELARMERIVAEAMEQGAVGLSTGLTYAPGMYADDAEIVALCKVAAAYGGFYAPHHRNYGAHAIEAYTACVDIARAAGIPLHLTHAHLGYPINRGRAGELIALVDAAIADGIDVTLDSYPYLAGSSYLHALLPAWAQEGGVDATLDRLSDDRLHERLRHEIEDTGHPAAHGVPTDWSTVVISGVTTARNAHLVGRTVADSARAAGRRSIDLFCEVLVEERLGATCVVHIGNEDNVRTIMAHSAHTGGTDGILVGAKPHPRAWGTFPRYLGHYVRELGILRLEDAIRKFTAQPARRLGQPDRGILKPGLRADVVAFDPATVADAATYSAPQTPPRGIPYVIVNGQPVIDGGEHTGARPGRALVGSATTSH